MPLYFAQRILLLLMSFCSLPLMATEHPDQSNDFASKNTWLGTANSKRSVFEQSLPEAYYNLGVKYYSDSNVRNNRQKARHLIAQAAEQGYVPAQYHLAHLFDTGDDGIKDPAKATYWYTQAANSGFSPAQHALAARLITGTVIAKDMEQGIYWLKKAAQQENLSAMRDLGFVYFNGIGVKKDYYKAQQLLIKPAQGNNPLATFLLGEINATGGYGVIRNQAQADIWHKKAYLLGFRKAKKAIPSSQTVALANKSKAEPIAKNKVKSVRQKERYYVQNGTYVQKNTKDKAATAPSQATAKKILPQAQMATETSANIRNDNKRFSQINAGHYTLQLMAAQLYDSITPLLKQYSDEHTYILHTRKKGQDFFILAYGNYLSYVDAKQAIASLPLSFQLDSSPWIRKITAFKLTAQ